MKKHLKRLAGRIDELTLRERGLVLLAIVAVLFMFWDTLLMQPLYQQQEQVEQDIAARQQSINKLAQSLQQAIMRDSTNPNARLEKERQELEQRIAALDARLEAETANVISPRRMATVLQEVLRRQQSLQLVEIRSLPPQAVLSSEGEEGFALSGNVYRHGLVIEIEGSYMDLLAYLREIEGLPYSFVWDRLDIEQQRYPENRIILRVFTLSLSEGLIGA
ncbi:MAG: hypothetical protein R3270_12015 [Gammaproteobacteria bacterium]|nr:hypothetical protein [Gammaproteobacteria bacterium]